MGTKRVIIKNEEAARDYLASFTVTRLGYDYDTDEHINVDAGTYLENLTLVERDGVTYVSESAQCYRCGGLGSRPDWTHWRLNGSTCFACHGANTLGATKETSLVDFARKERRKRLAADKAAAKRAAARDAKLEGQRNWSEANGHGRLTFDELNEKRAAERLAAREARKATRTYVGEVGNREVFEDLKVVFITGWSGDYGYTFLYKFENEDGNVLTWKSSVGIWSDGEPIETGAVVSLKGTIKAHTVYRDEKQTELTRCKVSEVAVSEAA